MTSARKETTEERALVDGLTSRDRDLIAELTAQVRGSVVVPADPQYDQARRVWNAMFDGNRPVAIARCLDEADVAAAVRVLRYSELPVAVRGGGHHIAGFGSCDGGVVIDLSSMRRAVPRENRLFVQGGATLHEVDVAGASVGRAVPVGVVSPTGIAGLTLSGGIGWLTRRHGYTCDNLVGARVVTATGALVHASDTENSDLLWGLRGGGGNFGIVTEFEFLSHPIGPVVAGEAYRIIRDADTAEAVLRFYRDWTAEASRDLTVWIAIEQVNADHDLLWPAHQGELVVALLACYAGSSPEDGVRSLGPMLREGHPEATRLGTIPMVRLQHLQDGSNAAATGMRSYMKGEMLTGLSDAAIAGIASACLQMPTENSLFEMGTLGGAMGDLAETDAAVGLRAAQYLGGFSMMSPVDDGLEEGIAWARSAWNSLTDASAGGVYLNFSGADGQDRVLGSLGAGAGGKRQRLIELKRKYDPTNFFRVNHNIDPADTDGSSA